MEAKFYGPLFRFLRGIVRRIYPKYHVQIPQNINGPVVYVSHHQNLFGPFVILLWFNRCVHTWMLHVFLDQDACFKQYADYTFTKRYRWNHTLAKIIAYPISYFIAALMNSCRGIPVYRGSRKILKTFQFSVEALSSGESIVIFPDIDYRNTSSSTNELYDGFLYLEKYYYQATGKHICFVPLYVSRKQRLLLANEQIYFRNGTDFHTEQKAVCQKIQKNLNQLSEICGDIK